MRSRPAGYQPRSGPPSSLEMRVIGRRVRSLRHEQSMTVARLAARCGLDRTDMRYVEDGRFRVTRIPSLAAALGVDRRVLVRGSFAWVGIRLQVERMEQVRPDLGDRGRGR